MQERLKPYVAVAKFIASAFGEDCEVILHDLSNVEESIVFIANNHITGREVGGHITDFALSTIYNPEYRNKEFVVNYKGYTDDGKKVLKSSTLYIRDEQGDIIGLLCINVEVTGWLRAKSLLDKLVAFSGSSSEVDLPPEPEPEPALPGRVDGEETFTNNINDMLLNIIDRALKEIGVEQGRMLMEEKKQIVTTLDRNGVFTLKGAVGTVAKKLDVSEQTVYRYLREIHANETK